MGRWCCKLDGVPVAVVKKWEQDFHTHMNANRPEIGQAILRTKDLSAQTIDMLSLAVDDFNQSWIAPQ